VSVAPPLALARITKRFGRITALDAADLVLRARSVHAVLGENGAGKTTLMRIAYGLIQPDEGSIAVDGAPAILQSPRDAIRRGIGMVHQHFTTVPSMTVTENIVVGREGHFNVDRQAVEIRALADRVGFAIDPHARAETLGVAAQQRLEILKALASGARILILDEPTAVLAPAEATELLRWLRQFADGGGAAILITHKLREAISVADEVTVLRGGRSVLRAAVADASVDRIASAMLGESAALAMEQPGHPLAHPVGSRIVVNAIDLSVDDSTTGSAVREATFEIRAGTMVGVAGVEGSGYGALLAALGRRIPLSRGSLDLPSRIGFIPEDRQRDALVLEFSVTENVALKNLGRRRGRIPWRSVASKAAALLAEYDVRGAEPRTTAGALSGGNQQRIVLGRELSDGPELIVAVNPTRGLDIRATFAVHERLRRACDTGSAVIVYSSDLDELMGLASRLLVVQAGFVRETAVERGEAGAAMLGLH
jgi:ABC-type uncharacterized transport system ATPase subunit